ncbi:MAG: SEC-C metal-binding domain-containing protein [Elusimicrobiota bacterium]|jgi:hypothetical protein
MQLYWNDRLAQDQPQPQDLETFLLRLEGENHSRLELRRGSDAALAAGRLQGIGYMLMLSAGGMAEVFLLAEPKRGRAADIFREYLAGRNPALVDDADQHCDCPVCAKLKAGREAPARQSPGPERKLGRNEPCPCGSGRKFKLCCAR